MIRSLLGGGPTLGTPSADIPLEEIADCLRTYRRVEIIEIVDATAPTTQADIADVQASRRADADEEERRWSKVRKQHYVCNYQCHLPKLDDLGIVDFDADRGTVTRDRNLPAVVSAIGALREVAAPTTPT